MDFLTRQFLSDAVRARKKGGELEERIQRIERTLNEHNEAIDRAAHANEENRRDFADILSAKLDRRDTDERRDLTREKKVSPFDWLGLAVSAAALIVVAAYTGLTAFQLVETKAAVDTANRSADTASRTLTETHNNFVADQRPIVWATTMESAATGRGSKGNVELQLR